MANGRIGSSPLMSIECLFRQLVLECENILIWIYDLFFRIHSEAVDFMDGKGAEMFGYCVYGVACSEVEVDCLTGDHHVRRIDFTIAFW